MPQAVLDEFEWANDLEDGDPRGLYEAALRVRDGEGLPQDEGVAVEWLKLAGERGVPEGHFEAGLILLDRAESYNWGTGIYLVARAGAAAGLVEAQTEVGRRLAYGHHAWQRDFAAYVWLLTAQKNGAGRSDPPRRGWGAPIHVQRLLAGCESRDGPYYPWL